MEILEICSKRFTQTMILDKPGHGNANHEYLIVPVDSDNSEEEIFCSISFQNGSVEENGVNGIHQEDLLKIVLHRLESFQAGDFKCDENDSAITSITDALNSLRHRTTSREIRGVEGTSQK